MYRQNESEAQPNKSFFEEGSRNDDSTTIERINMETKVPSVVALGD